MEKNHPSQQIYSKVRASYLDLSDETSGIHKNEMRGFYILFILITSFYIVTASLSKFFAVGYFVEDSFFWTMVEDGKFVALIWPGMFLYTWLAYFLQRIILKGLNNVLATVFQHLTQSIMFMIITYIVLDRNWGFSQTLYAVLLTFTHFMKMHTYTLVNRDLRRDYLRGVKNCPYPNNITISNYLNFLITPVLVYQTDYPKRPGFRFGYFLLKVLLFLVEAVCMYMLITENIVPTITQAKELSFLDVYSRLIVPCVVMYNLMFQIVFEQILNVFAELSGFGDREFYQDWWNSNGFEDFARKWNRPVHLFLYKHVYLECINEFKTSKQRAQFITFIFSACCHEFLCALIMRKISPYLFGLMMFQLPLMVLVKLINQKYFGIYLFWTGIITGPALLLTLYVKF
jgi:sterol O-acyltransferase